MVDGAENIVQTRRAGVSGGHAATPPPPAALSSTRRPTRSVWQYKVQYVHFKPATIKAVVFAKVGNKFNGLTSFCVRRKGSLFSENEQRKSQVFVIEAHLQVKPISFINYETAQLSTCGLGQN